MKTTTIRWLILLSLTLRSMNLLADDSADQATTIQQLKAQIEALDQKIRILERKDELNEDDKQKRREESPKIIVGDKGFSFESADQKFNLRLRGLLQVDHRSYFDHSGTNPGTDSFVLRRVRPIVTGKVFESYEFTFLPEFAGGSNGASSAFTILDAFVNANYAKELQLRVGKFKAPVGLEQIQVDPNRSYAETSLATNLVPNRDIGLQLHGELFDGLLAYQVGLFNGSPDGANAPNIDFDNNREGAARLIVSPFKMTEINELRGFSFGIAGTEGNKNGTTTNRGLTSGYLTEGQQTFFAYRNSSTTTQSTNLKTGAVSSTTNNNITIADGEHWRLVPQGTWFYGPLGFQGEYAVSNQVLRKVASGSVPGNNRTGRVQNEGWSLAAQFVLTGEDASFTGVVPRTNFSLSKGTWGALEFVARYSDLTIDSRAFSGGTQSFADRTTQAAGASTYTLGLNWYLNRNVRILTDYIQTDFHGGSQAAGSVTAQDEKVVTSRLQLYY